jgi:ubiquinone/menaquinone biosynthesis C-methylase UbiE
MRHFIRMSKKHKDAVRKQFTKTVEAFSKYAVRDTPEVLAEKVEFVKAQPSELVLDVACGPGEFVLALAPHARFAYGVDLTFQMLQQAQAFQVTRQVSRAAFLCGEAEQLPFPDGSLDLVTCQCSFHHMPKPELALAEMVRVAKPEGRVLVIDTLAPESGAKFELHNRIERVRDPSHALTLRLTSFLSMFEERNLSILRQGLRGRQRSFNQWMLRAGLEPPHKRYQETRKLLEDSLEGDRAGFSAHAQGDDFTIVHNEGMFLLGKQVGGR